MKINKNKNFNFDWKEILFEKYAGPKTLLKKVPGKEQIANAINIVPEISFEYEKYR